MQRILNGTYGICEKTGKRIEEERLRAVPWTRFSRDAQDTIEEEKRRRAQHGKPTSRPERPISRLVREISRRLPSHSRTDL